MSRAFKQVDVFTDTLGSGNPVAVVLDGDGLTDGDMANFAAWTNLSETTFVLAPTEPGADYRVRIFTPTEELPFAGHPTIGTCHAWLQAGGAPAAADQIVQQCEAGLITLRTIDGHLAFETPPPLRSGPVDQTDLDHAIGCLGLDPADVVESAWVDNGPGWVGLLLTDVQALRDIKPTLVGPGTYIGVAALTPATEPGDSALEVRAFFYAGGPREDPVTGSLNGSLAEWLLEAGTLQAPYVASQGTAIGRDGRVYISQSPAGGVWVGGDAVTGIDGIVHLGAGE